MRLWLEDRLSTRNVDSDTNPNHSRKDQVAFSRRVDNYFQLYKQEIDLEIDYLTKSKKIGGYYEVNNDGTLEDSVKKVEEIIKTI